MKICETNKNRGSIFRYNRAIYLRGFWQFKQDFKYISTIIESFPQEYLPETGRFSFSRKRIVFLLENDELKVLFERVNGTNTRSWVEESIDFTDQLGPDVLWNVGSSMKERKVDCLIVESEHKNYVGSPPPGLCPDLQPKE